MGKPIIAIVNSFTQFVPGHTHLHEIGQQVKAEIEKLGCFAAEFNTIAIDDGIAMGHDGMLYSLPSRDIIADSVEYMVNAHKADAMVCISNCDKITPGMLMAAMRLNIPTVFVSGGPMEAGEARLSNGEERKLDLIRWDMASELSVFDYYDVNAVLAYLVKANMVARWSRLDRKFGREIFERLRGELDGRELINKS